MTETTVSPQASGDGHAQTSSMKQHAASGDNRNGGVRLYTKTGRALLYIKLYNALPAGAWMNARTIFNSVDLHLIAWPWEMHTKLNMLVEKKLLARRGEQGNYEWFKPPGVRAAGDDRGAA